MSPQDSIAEWTVVGPTKAQPRFFRSLLIAVASGLTPAVTYVPVNDPSQDGIVQSQTPEPGADAKSGEVVIINVGQLQNGTPGGDGTTTTTSP